MRPTRIGVFGGTFDPPHNGHLVVGVNAADQLRLDRTLFVVANEPWQKVGERQLTAPEHRLAMVAAMVAGVDTPGLEASDIEIRRGGATYTADTLAEIEREAPGAQLWLVVGADVSGALRTWKRLGEVKARAGLAVVDRAGVGSGGRGGVGSGGRGGVGSGGRGGAAVDLDGLAADGWRVARVTIPRLDISSSAIRARLDEGLPIDGLVPPAAIRILRERGLYARS